jgi:hypothetical protein
VQQTDHRAVIFFVVLVRLMIVSLAAAVSAFSAPGLAAAKAPKPKPKPTHKAKGLTAKQIHAAVSAAEHSPSLWATVNVCTSSSDPTIGDVAGIRGQMPGLGFAATLLMNVSVDYWNYTDMKFESAGATSTISLGKGTHGIHQGGVSFPFAPPTPGSTFLVRGSITFEWKMGNKVIGTVTRPTGHGYQNVAYSNPPGFSAGTCTLT